MVLKGKSSGKLSKEIEAVEETAEGIQDDVDIAIATAAGYTIEGFETGYGRLGKYLSVASTARIGGTATLGSQLTVTNKAYFNSDLSVGKDVKITGILNVVKQVVFSSTLSIGSDVKIGGKMDIGGGMNVAALNIDGNLVVRGNLLVIGNTTFTDIHSETIRIQDSIIQLNANLSNTEYAQNTSNDIGWFGQTTISSHDTCVGSVWDHSEQMIKFFRQDTVPSSTIDSNASRIGILVANIIASEKLSVGGNTLINNHLTISGNLAVKGNTSISDALSVGGKMTLNSTLSVGETTVSILNTAGASIFASTLSIGKQTVLKSSLSVGGATVIESTLSVAQASVFASTLSVGSNVLISKHLEVLGNIISGATLSVAGNVIAGYHLSIAGKAVLSSTLSIGKQTVLKSSLSVGGATVIESTLSVGSTVRVNSYTLPSSIGSAGYALKVPDSGSILEWAQLSGAITVKEVDGNPSISDVSIIEFDQSTGLTVSDQGSNTARVSLGSHWKDLEVSGQTTLSPTGEETLAVVAGSNMTITTNSATSPKTITFASSGGGSGSGTVNSGTANKIPYYANTGTALTETSSLYWDNSTNRLGINKSSPTVDLDVTGSGKFSGDLEVSQTITAQEVSATSDKKFKTNISTIKNPLEKICKLRGVMFDWKYDEYPQFSNRKQVGVIAQEVEEIVPEVVLNKEHKSVCYDKMVALLIEGIKEQQSTIKNLENRLNNMTNKLSSNISTITSMLSDHETAIHLINDQLYKEVQIRINTNKFSYTNDSIVNRISTINGPIYSV